MNEYGFSCPLCGSADVRRSHRKGFGEIPKMLTGVYPFRCLGCGERFFGNVWMLTTGGFANCPRCLRLSVLPWDKRESHVSGWDRLRTALGAHTYRCLPCRHTFLSFRKCMPPGEPEPAAETELQSAPYPADSGNDLAGR